MPFMSHIKPRKKPRRGPPDVPPERWRNPDYLQFLRDEGRCLACLVEIGKIGYVPLLHYCVNQCEPMHGHVNGMSSKGPDAEAIPGCQPHHVLQHKIGWSRFEAQFGFSREAEAAKWWEAFHNA